MCVCVCRESFFSKHPSDDAELGTRYGVVLSSVCFGVTCCGLWGHIEVLFSWLLKGDHFVVTIGQLGGFVFFFWLFLSIFSLS